MEARKIGNPLFVFHNEILLLAFNSCVYCTTCYNKCGRIGTKWLFFFIFIDKKLANRISYQIWYKRFFQGKFGGGGGGGSKSTKGVHIRRWIWTGRIRIWTGVQIRGESKLNLLRHRSSCGRSFLPRRGICKPTSRHLNQTKYHRNFFIEWSQNFFLQCSPKIGFIQYCPILFHFSAPL